jgi:hypothetical protein
MTTGRDILTTSMLHRNIRGVKLAGYNWPVIEYQPVTGKSVWYSVENNR